MKRTDSITRAAEEIQFLATLGGSHYFVLEVDGLEYQIRVSDHAANALRNTMGYDGFMSFITNWNKQQCNMDEEYVIDNEGNVPDYGRTIENLLEWELC